MTNEAIRATIEGSLITFYNKFMYSDPLYKNGERRIELLIGLWSPVTGRTSLLPTEGPTVRFAKEECEFLGIGAYFARYACGKLFKHQMSFRDVTRLAAHILGQTKANVPDCGKHSQFVVISNTGRLSPTSDIDITFGETYAQQFQGFVSEVMFDLANPDFDMDQIVSKFKDSSRMLRMLVEANRYYQSLMENLSK